MFQNTNFWIGLGIGVVAGIFGYKLMQQRQQQLHKSSPPAPPRPRQPLVHRPWKNCSVRKKLWKT